MLITVWKSDIKDKLVSKELAYLYQTGRAKLLKEGKNFLLFEVPDEVYYKKIYPKFPKEVLQHIKDLYFYEITLDTPNEFEAIIFVPRGYISASFLRKILPHKWFTLLKDIGILENFLDIHKNCLKGKLEKEFLQKGEYKDSYYHHEEIGCYHFKYIYKDENEEVIAILELHFSEEGGDFYYVYFKKKQIKKS